MHKSTSSLQCLLQRYADGPVISEKRLLAAVREEMFARSSLLKRHTTMRTEPGVTSDVDPVSTDTDSDPHEDPNELLEDLPPEVRDAEIEHGVLPPENDQTRSAENPTQAAKREKQKAQRGGGPSHHLERSSIHDDPYQLRDSSSPPREVDRSKSSRSRSARSNRSARRAQQETPFGSSAQQDGYREDKSSSAALFKSTSELDRLRKMSSDTIDARQPKSDLPLMRHSPGSQGAGSSSQNPEAPSSPPEGKSTASDKQGLVKEYRDSLGPIGILGPAGRQPAGSRSRSDRSWDQGERSGAPKQGGSSRGLQSSERSGSLHRRRQSNGRRGPEERTGSDGLRGDQRHRGDQLGDRRLSSAAARRSGSLSLRMSELAEQQPSAQSRSLSPPRQGVQRGEQNC